MRTEVILSWVMFLLSLVLVACTHNDIVGDGVSVDIKNRSLYNEAAYVPSQCYTKTEDADGRIHNPCFTCHIDAVIPNYMDDWDLQRGYTFREYARTNRWSNLFKDRRNAVSAISDAEITEYIRADNYITPEGQLLLASTLKQLPQAWDVDGDGVWNGYIPDCYYDFDSEGFDRDANGKDTGWRAFGYYPLPGTFWPTNGSTDDVLIRLPKDFRMLREGVFDRETYKVNLLIVESLMKQKTIESFAIDETRYGVDLDKDGQLATAEQIVFDYAPRDGRQMSYVGMAKAKHHAIAAGLYPVGTEFLHSVRYVDVDKEGKVHLSPRMKELRYGKKVRWMSYSDHRRIADEEMQDRRAFPDRLEVFIGDAERGISNKRGWRYQGFIEDASGALRPQSYEENLQCIGCHANIGVLADSTFAFQRKFEKDSFQEGWFHWSQHGLNGIKEPKTPDGRFEYTLYLQENHAGDEFRANTEIVQQFFNGEALDHDAVEQLHHNIAHLLFPSPSRALELNKAYKVIVNEQSFIYGRDATLMPLIEVHKELNDEQKTGIVSPVRYEKSL